jgi:hypothetical protein
MVEFLEDRCFNFEMAFAEVHDALVYAFADEYLNEEKFLILNELYEPVNPMYPYWEFQPFCLENMNSSEFLAEFRVKKDDIPLVEECLHIPDRFVCPQGTICSGFASHHGISFSSRHHILNNTLGP